MEFVCTVCRYKNKAVGLLLNHITQTGLGGTMNKNNLMAAFVLVVLLTSISFATTDTIGSTAATTHGASPGAFQSPHRLQEY